MQLPSTSEVYAGLRYAGTAAATVATVGAVLGVLNNDQSAALVADVKQIKYVAELPSRDVLLAKVLGGMQAPISNFVYTLSGVLSKFVRTLDAVRAAKKA